MGPLISSAQRDKVLGYIDSGKQEGAKVISGGHKCSTSGGGYWVEPTILADYTLHMKCVKDEVSPLLCNLSLLISTY